MTVGTASWVFAQRAELSNLLNLESTLSDVIVNIIKQYRSYVSAVRGLEITRLSLQRSQEQLEITRELINSGRITSYNVCYTKLLRYRTGLSLIWLVQTHVAINALA